MAGMSVNWNWRARPVTSADAESKERAAGITALGDSIGKMVRARRGEQDRQRRMAEEDRKRQAYAEAAELMRSNPALSALEAERAEIVGKISKLEMELGLNG